MSDFIKLTKKMHFQYIFLFLIFFHTIKSIRAQDYSCEKDEDCLSSYNCINKSCVHKNLFPIKLNEILLMIFLSFLSMIATSAGIGGGPVFGVMFTFILNFSLSEATPITNFMIFISSVTTFFIGLKMKINNPETKFVDYKFILVICPILLMSTKIGVILNKILPSLILNIILTLLLLITSYKTYKNAMRFKKLEENTKNTLLNKLNESPKINTKIEDIIKLSKNLEQKPSESLNKNQHDDFEKDILNHKKEENNLNQGFFSFLNKIEKSALDLEKIKVILLLEILMIADYLIEGGDKIASIIKIEKCSFLYWIIFVLFSICCLCLTWKFYCNAKDEYLSKIKFIEDSKIDNGDPNLEFDIGTPENEKKIINVLLICCLAGILGGMLGIGGGIILAPLMLEMCINPQTTSSTSNFILIINSSTGLVLFILSGNFIYDYSLAFGLCCFLFTYYGGNILNEYIKRTKKNSLLIFFLFFVMVFSLILLPINGFLRAKYDANNGINIFALNDFC